MAALVDGLPKAAFNHLREAIGYPCRLTEAEWVDALEVFGRIAEALEAGKLPRLAERVRLDPSDPDALYDLGYELIEYDLNRVAATVLARAADQRPGEVRILTELTCAFERSGDHKEACRVLAARPALIESSFLCRYLLAFNAVMTGDLATPREHLPALKASTDEAYDGMADRIEGMLRRADLVQSVTALDGDDLRGWQYVITGSLLLHLSPFGFDEGMRGRYCWIQDNANLCREGLARLRTVLESLDAVPPRVLALADRDSRVLAEATAQLQQLPLENWPEEGGDERAGLVVGYDLRLVPAEQLGTLRAHRPGQILWTQATEWTAGFPITSDLTTLMHQTVTPPWGPRLVIDPETKEATSGEGDDGPLEAIARRMLAAELEEDALSDLESLVALARAARSELGFLRGTGKRHRQWECSPVPSNRF